LQNLFNELDSFVQAIQDGSFQLSTVLDTYPTLLIAAAGLLLLVILIIVFSSLLRRSNPKKEEPDNTTRVFVPVEKVSNGPDTVLLPLVERIVSCEEELTPVVSRRIIMDSPDTLAAVTAAYPRCTPKLQESLLKLVRDNRMMEAYGQRICREGVPLGILADAWAWFSSPEILRGYVEMLADRDQQVQMNTVRLLSGLRDVNCLPLLVSALAQPERYVSSRVAEVFVSMPEQSASLLSMILPKLDDSHKLRVLDTLAQINSAFPLENVLKCLKSPNYNVRVAAALALGWSRMTECVPDLIMCTTDKQWQVRAAAAKALGMIGDNRALSVLYGLSGDTEGWVADNAKQALKMFENA